MAKKFRKKSIGFYARKIVRQTFTHPNNEGRRLRALARTFGWQAYKRIVRRPVTISVFQRSKMKIYPDSTSGAKLIYFNQYFDLAEMRFLERYLRPGDLFFDGGSNIGVYSILACETIGPSGRVIAIEPIADNAMRIRENALLNGYTQIEVVEAALLDTAGEARMLADCDTSNSLVDSATRHETVQVTLQTIDALLADAHCALAKLDLEGAEYKALLGARRALERTAIPVLLIELLPGQLRKQASSPEQVRNLLEGLGYVAHTLSDVGEPSEATSTPLRGDFCFIHRDARCSVEQRLSERPA